jgi:hypothetical protein
MTEAESGVIGGSEDEKDKTKSLPPDQQVDG